MMPGRPATYLPIDSLSGADVRLQGCSALVTGASSGIGAAAAAHLAAAGCRLVLLGRDSTRLNQVVRRTGGSAMVADLTTPAGLSRAGAAAAEADLLVNNAGCGFAGELATMAAEDVSALVALNLTAPMQLARAAVGAMRSRGHGHLVFVSSIAAVGVAEEAVYAATKAGLRTFAASLRSEVSSDGLGVTTVLPGAVDTAFFGRRGRFYDRRVPRQLAATTVARALVRAVERDRAEVFVPAWLTIAARMQGALPGTFEILARRFG